MRKKPVVFLLLGVLLVCVLSACGGGGGGTTTAPAAIQFALSADNNKKNVLSDNMDTATITAIFVSDVAPGTGVTFSVPANTAVLSVPNTTTTGANVTATTTNNKASVIIKGNNISGPIVVTATSGSITQTIPIVFSSNLSANAAVTSVAPNNPVTIDIQSTVTAAGNLTVATSPAAGVDVVQPTDGVGAGQFTAKVTPHVLGPITVTVTNTVSNSTSIVTFDSKTQIPMSVSPAGDVLANGVDTATVTADFTGITIADNEPITFTATDGAILSSSQALTSGGKATINVTSSKAATYQVTAAYKGSAGSTNVVFAQPQFAISASKAVGLADNSDAITITVTYAGVADGRPVNFNVSGIGTLGTSTTTIRGGVASTTITSPTPGTATVTASADSLSATTAVKFINQPHFMDVYVSLNPAINSLGTLQFTLLNDANSTYAKEDPPFQGAYKLTGINTASAPSTWIFLTPVSSTKNSIALLELDPNGINTQTAPIIKVRYSISAGLPRVQIDSSSPMAASRYPNLSVFDLGANQFGISIVYDTE